MPLNPMPNSHTWACYPVRGQIDFTCALETQDRRGVFFFHTANQKFVLPKIRTLVTEDAMRRLINWSDAHAQQTLGHVPSSFTENPCNARSHVSTSSIIYVGRLMFNCPSF
jgi:hypothetical protein